VKEYNYEGKDGTTITGLSFDPNTMNETQKAELASKLAQARASGIKTMPWGGVSAPQANTVNASDAVQDQGKPSLIQQVGDFAKGAGKAILPGGMDEIGRNVGAAVRGVAGGVANTAGLVVDPITAIVNLVTPDKQEYITLNQSIQSLLTQVGVLNVATEAEKILHA